MKPINTVLTSSILLVLAFILYSSQHVFFFRYEPEYYENWYYHSQWNYPQSTRGISDGELYKFVGYRLVNGENPFDLQYETPPLGKYLYGLAEHTLGNPLWVSLLLYFSSLTILYLFAADLFPHTRLPLLATLLFATTPFVATQIKETMLDLPLMFFYLTHAWLFIRFLNRKNLPYLIASGVFLGLATGTKFGIYTLPVFIFEFLIIIRVIKLSPAITFNVLKSKPQNSPSRNLRSVLTSNKFLYPLIYPVTAFFGYLLAYFCYFQRHPNPLPWLRLHQKVLQFYLNSQTQVNYLNQWKGIFLNTYRGFWQGSSASSLGDWSPLLPLGVIAAVVIFARALKNHRLVWVYLSGLTLIFLAVNTVVPFWPRYLMPAIPLFVLLVAYILKKYPAILLLLALLNLPYLAHSFDTSDPTGDAQAAARFISTRAYRELYRSLDPHQRATLPEDQFTSSVESFLTQLQTRSVTAQPQTPTLIRPSTQADIPYQITYLTSFGNLTHQSTFNFVKVHNQWKLNWNWDYLWSGYTPDAQIKIDLGTIPITKIQDSSGRTLATRGPGQTVSVIPRLMFDWNQHLNALSRATGQPTTEIDHWIRLSVPDQYPRFVGYLDPSLGPSAADQALAIPGVSLQDIDYLIPNSRYLDTAIHAINQLHQDRPNLFYVQSDVSLVNGQKEIPLPFDRLSETNLVVKF
jgi:hypothetical protein